MPTIIIFFKKNDEFRVNFLSLIYDVNSDNIYFQRIYHKRKEYFFYTNFSQIIYYDSKYYFFFIFLQLF